MSNIRFFSFQSIETYVCVDAFAEDLMRSESSVQNKVLKLCNSYVFFINSSFMYEVVRYRIFSYNWERHGNVVTRTRTLWLRR
jgi:predicted transcriptional regulator